MAAKAAAATTPLRPTGPSIVAYTVPVPRVWLTCALAAAAVVAVILLLTNRRDADADGPKGIRAPPPLSEQEVRTYIEVMPQLQHILGNIAAEFQAARSRGPVDEEAFGMKAQAQVDALLGRRHLTRESWQRLSERVEYAVNAVRAAAEFDTARAGIEERIELKKALLGRLAREDERVGVRKEIAEAEALLAGGGPPLLERDRELIRQYWTALDAAAPQVGPQPKPP